MDKNSLCLHLNTDQDLVDRAVPSRRILEISLQAPGASIQNNRPPLNLALVLDRSGSMAGEKLEYVKQAAGYVLDRLQARDRVALVVYDDEIEVLSHSVAATEDNIKNIKHRLRSIRAGEFTLLSDGWLAGCQEVAAAAQDGSINRTLLLTDGLANRGITDLEKLAQHARELAQRGVSTSTFGVGSGYNEHLLEAMSNQGGGNFYFIETPDEIPGIFLREFKELATVTAREVEIDLEIPPQVDLRVLAGWRLERAESQLRIFLGNLYADQTQMVYLQLLVPPANGKRELVFDARICGKGETDQLFEGRAEIVFRYADQEDIRVAPRDWEVLNRFARVDLAETTREALILERQGERDKASSLLKRSIDEHRLYTDAGQSKEYQQMAERMRHGLGEIERKLAHYASYNRRRHREPKKEKEE